MSLKASLWSMFGLVVGSLAGFGGGYVASLAPGPVLACMGGCLVGALSMVGTALYVDTREVIQK